MACNDFAVAVLEEERKTLLWLITTWDNLTTHRLSNEMSLRNPNHADEAICAAVYHTELMHPCRYMEILNFILHYILGLSRGAVNVRIKYQV